MRKTELVSRLAKQTHLSRAEAADQLDRVVTQIISNLKKGESAPLPGLGKFIPGPRWNFRFDRRASSKEPSGSKR